MLTMSAKMLYGILSRLPSPKRLPPRLVRSLVRPPRLASGSMLLRAPSAPSPDSRRTAWLATWRSGGGTTGVTATRLDATSADAAVTYGRTAACMTAPPKSLFRGNLPENNLRCLAYRPVGPEHFSSLHEVRGDMAAE